MAKPYTQEYYEDLAAKKIEEAIAGHSFSAEWIERVTQILRMHQERPRQPYWIPLK